MAGIAIMVRAAVSAVTRQYANPDAREDRMQGTSTAAKPGSQRAPSWNIAPYDSIRRNASEEELNDISDAIWLSFPNDRYSYATTNHRPINAEEWRNMAQAVF